MSKLKAYDSFDKAFSLDNYTSLPDDYLVIATDVKGSTKAIEQGKYKEVNTLGASCIIGLINACKPEEICYQFGGDGALVVIPPNKKDEAEKALSYLEDAAEKKFGLGLRIAVWKVEEFLKRQLDFKVLKVKVSENNSIYMFCGDGVEASDVWLKQESPCESLYSKQKYVGGVDYVEGLECRWNPLISQRGQILTAIVKPRVNREEISSCLGQVFSLLSSFGEENSRLVKTNHLKAKFPPSHYSIEWKMKSLSRGNLISYVCYLSVMLKVLLLTPIVYLFKEKIPFLKEYGTHSDFQKFDGSFRFVRDMKAAEIKELEALLQEMHQEGKIFYGTHKCSQALMTCMVYSLENHMHFIDGDDGGYAMAAKMLKKQISSST
jgi:hypothetical protein